MEIENPQMWSAAAIISDSMRLDSKSCVMNCNPKKFKFSILFECTCTNEGKHKQMTETLKSMVVTIYYRGIAVCNINQTEKFSKVDENKYTASLDTHRIKSVVEISRIKECTDIYYYIEYNSHYEEQKAVCLRAENISE